jgi:hypothetical protein
MYTVYGTVAMSQQLDETSGGNGADGLLKLTIVTNILKDQYRTADKG